MEALCAKYIPKGMATKTIIPKYHVLILFMKAHISMLIVMQIHETILMIVNPCQVMFSYWAMEL